MENGGDELDALGIKTTLGNIFNTHHYGVTWVSSALGTYSFISTHSPVYDQDGNYYHGAYTWFAVDGAKLSPSYGTTLGPNGVIPEPASLSFLGVGLLGLLGMRRKRG